LNEDLIGSRTYLISVSNKMLETPSTIQDQDVPAIKFGNLELENRIADL
jgi:hypothetical protein